jgi:hypothetical protein
VSEENPNPRRSQRIAEREEANSSQKYHAGYVDTAGKLKRKRENQVPESCIESTETILRRWDNSNYKFDKGGQGSNSERKPMHVLLKKGYNWDSLNVTDADQEDIFSFGKDRTSFFAEDDLLDYLHIGQGAAFLRRDGRYDNGFNMHFLGVIKKESQMVTLSDVSEPANWDETTKVALKTIEAKTVRELREKLGSPYNDEKEFVFGRVGLSLTDDPASKRAKRQRRS